MTEDRDALYNLKADLTFGPSRQVVLRAIAAWEKERALRKQERDYLISLRAAVEQVEKEIEQRMFSEAHADGDEVCALYREWRAALRAAREGTTLAESSPAVPE